MFPQQDLFSLIYLFAQYISYIVSDETYLSNQSWSHSLLDHNMENNIITFFQLKIYSSSCLRHLIPVTGWLRPVFCAAV